MDRLADARGKAGDDQPAPGLSLLVEQQGDTLVAGGRQCPDRRDLPHLARRPARHERPVADLARHARFQRQDLQCARRGRSQRSEEHTSELQSLMRISSAVFCLKKKKKKKHNTNLFYSLQKHTHKYHTTIRNLVKLHKTIYYYISKPSVVRKH